MSRKERQRLITPNMKGKKLTIELIQHYVSKTDEILLSNSYLGSNQKLNFACKYGHTYSVRWQDFKKGFRCKHCSMGFNKYVYKDTYCELHIIYKNETKIVYIDSEDVELVSKYKWRINNSGYASATINRKMLLMHRLIMGENSELTVDHINRNRLDNRKSNLRLVTRLMQAHNKTKRLDNKTGRTGVSYHKKSNSYLAKLTYKGVKYQKYFSIPLYGNEQAFKLACDYRLQLENRFNFLTEK